MDLSRRSLVFRISGLIAFGVTGPLRADPGEAKETDADAKALGYRTDASHVDRAKYPQYSEPQQCGNCQLYQPGAGGETGSCSALGGKLVRAKGWCTGYQAAM